MRKNSNIPSLVCALLASLATGGNTYAFGLYGAELKSTLMLSQSQLDTVSTAYFCAGLLSWLPGRFIDKYGTKRALAVAGVAAATFLSLYWAVARKFLPVPPGLIVPTLSFLGIMTFMSNSMAVGSVFKTIVVSCGPGSKGTVVGIAKGYVGLGVGAYTCLFVTLVKRGAFGSTLDFLLMNAILALACFTLPAIFFLPNPRKAASLRENSIRDDTTPLHFGIMYFSLAVMVSVIVAHIVIELRSHALDHARNESAVGYYMVVTLLLAWLVPIFSLFLLPRRRQQHDGNAMDIFCCGDGSTNSSVPSEDTPLLSSPDPTRAQTSCFRHVPDLTLNEMLQTPSAYMLLWISTVLVGAGLVLTNNMGQMVESLGFPLAAASTSLTVFSVAQAVVRVVTGALSESALQWKIRRFGIETGIPRPTFFIVACLIGLLAQLVFAIARNEILFVIAVALAGTSFGMTWPLMVLVVGEIFGTKNHGANYMFFDGATCALGTLFLSMGVAQYVYETHSDLEDSLTCMGAQCFQMTHITIAGLLVACVMAGMRFLTETEWVYNPVHRVLEV